MLFFVTVAPDKVIKKKVHDIAKCNQYYIIFLCHFHSCKVTKQERHMTMTSLVTLIYNVFLCHSCYRQSDKEESYMTLSHVTFAQDKEESYIAMSFFVSIIKRLSPLHLKK